MQTVVVCVRSLFFLLNGRANSELNFSQTLNKGKTHNFQEIELKPDLY